MSKDSTSRNKNGVQFVDFDQGTEIQQVDWLWTGWMAKGTLCVVQGDPDLNKSSMLLDIAARLTRGGELPLSQQRNTAMSALLLSGEDSPQFTIKPRLLAAKADMSRVFRLKEDQKFLLRDNLDSFSKAIEANDIGFVVIDPLDSFVGVDTNKNADVRPVLTRLKNLAEDRHVVIVLLRHLTKNNEMNSRYRGLGSVSITAAARSEIVVAPDPDDSTKRIMILSKQNLSLKPPAVRFSPESDSVEADGKMIETLRIRWEGEASGATLEGLLPTSSQSKRQPKIKRERAKELLLRELASGPKPFQELVELVEQEEISSRTLTDAKQELGVRSKRIGNHWEWSLPLPPEATSS